MTNQTITCLERAHVALADPAEQFSFLDWNCCTTGHIFRASLGDSVLARRWYLPDTFEGDEYARIQPFADVLRETAVALGWVEPPPSEHRPPEESALFYVSQMTVAKARARGARPMPGAMIEVWREDALAVIDQALHALRTRELVAA